jgi:hypothetical protein
LRQAAPATFFGIRCSSSEMNARSVGKRICAIASLAAGALWATVAAVPSSSPYATIAACNPFRIQPVVTPPRPAELARPAPVSALAVEVTGITSVVCPRRALLEIADGGRMVSRPVLAEGGAADGVEVVCIDVETCRVTVRIQGVETLLPLGKGVLRPTEPSPVPRLR